MSVLGAMLVSMESTLFPLGLLLGLILGAVGWVALIVDAWRIGQPLSYGLGHRRASVGVNGVLCFSVAGVMLACSVGSAST